MFAYIKGTVTEIGTEGIVIETGGIDSRSLHHPRFQQN